MKVSLNGRNFYVGWKFHNPELEKIHPHSKLRRMEKTALEAHLKKYPLFTTVFVNEEKGGEWVPIVEETVTYHHRDVYDKHKARKFALTKALDKVFPFPAKLRPRHKGENDESYLLEVANVKLTNAPTKQLRDPFWEQYLKTVPIDPEFKLFIKLMKKFKERLEEVITHVFGDDDFEDVEENHGLEESEIATATLAEIKTEE